jgi:periplasmic divalent cation tolerance protein
MKKEYCLITTTFDSLEVANKVVESLLNKRLISCAQISNIKSLYHWKGKIANSDEILLQMKSRKNLYKKVEEEILKLHNYEIPQILMYDIIDGYEGYLNWIEEETK